MKASFFSQQNCTTKDAQQKYNSKTAQMYREKLHQAAIKAQRTYGTKLNIDDNTGHSSNQQSNETEAPDFFAEAANTQENRPIALIPAYEIKDTHIADKSHEGPNVLVSLGDSANQGEEQTSSATKSNILQKKPAQAKKKGLGAQKVSTDFKEIERAMLEQEKNKELELQQQAKTKEEQEKQLEKQMASMKLAYNNIDKQREKEEAKLMQSDPKKAQQLERLGMAVGTRSVGISHSAVSDMQIIQQEGVSGKSTSNNYNQSFASKNKDFFDEMDSHFQSSSNKYEDDNFTFKGFGSSKKLMRP